MKVILGNAHLYLDCCMSWVTVRDHIPWNGTTLRLQLHVLVVSIGNKFFSYIEPHEACLLVSAARVLLKDTGFAGLRKALLRHLLRHGSAGNSLCDSK